MRGTNKTFLLLILLCVSIMGNLFLAGLLLRPEPAKSPVTGTYLAGIPGVPDPDAQYFVFTYDGTYARYQQFHMLEEGRYAAGYDGVYRLTPDGSGSARSVFVADGERVFYPDGDGTALVFIRVSDTPMYINVGHGGPAEAGQ